MKSIDSTLRDASRARNLFLGFGVALFFLSLWAYTVKQSERTFFALSTIVSLSGAIVINDTVENMKMLRLLHANGNNVAKSPLPIVLLNTAGKEQSLHEINSTLATIGINAPSAALAVHSAVNKIDPASDNCTTYCKNGEWYVMVSYDEFDTFTGGLRVALVNRNTKSRQV